MTVLAITLCGCGCGKPANRRFAVGHYLRQQKPFDATRHKVEDRGYVTPCWVWQGATRANGYGSVQYCGAPDRAHRAYYRHFVGPIPDGLALDHLCFVTNCVNPSHLEPVTAAENTRRAIKVKGLNGPMAANKAKTHCIHGHEFNEANTYPRPDGGRLCRACRNRRCRELQRRRRHAA